MTSIDDTINYFKNQWLAYQFTSNQDVDQLILEQLQLSDLQKICHTNHYLYTLCHHNKNSQYKLTKSKKEVGSIILLQTGFCGITWVLLSSDYVHALLNQLHIQFDNNDTYFFNYIHISKYGIHYELTFHGKWNEKIKIYPTKYQLYQLLLHLYYDFYFDTMKREYSYLLSHNDSKTKKALRKNGSSYHYKLQQYKNLLGPLIQ